MRSGMGTAAILPEVESLRTQAAAMRPSAERVLSSFQTRIR